MDDCRKNCVKTYFKVMWYKGWKINLMYQLTKISFDFLSAINSYTDNTDNNWHPKQSLPTQETNVVNMVQSVCFPTSFDICPLCWLTTHDPLLSVTKSQLKTNCTWAVRAPTLWNVPPEQIKFYLQKHDIVCLSAYLQVSVQMQWQWLPQLI